MTKKGSSGRADDIGLLHPRQSDILPSRRPEGRRRRFRRYRSRRSNYINEPKLSQQIQGFCFFGDRKITARYRRAWVLEEAASPTPKCKNKPIVALEILRETLRTTARVARGRLHKRTQINPYECWDLENRCVENSGLMRKHSSVPKSLIRCRGRRHSVADATSPTPESGRSEEHTSELQSPC